LSGGGAAAGVGNVLAGGIIGGLVDGSNGSLNSLDPNPLYITLTPDGSTADAPSASVMPEAAPAAAPEAAPEAAPVAAQADPATTAPSPGVEG
jgi:hypothetical protein